MKKESLYERLIPKNRNLDKIALEAVKNPEIISFLLSGIHEKNARIKFGCFNTLILISEKNPDLVYPYFDLFVEYLNSENKIIKLGGIKILYNLSRVDDKNKFDKIFDRFYSFITNPTMTTAANVSKGSVTIAKAKPYLTPKITNQLLKVAQTKYNTEECKNILIGHVISSFDKIFMQIENKKTVLNFVESNINSSWKATKTKAQKFIKKYA